MTNELRQSTLQSLNLGTVYSIFKNGQLPVQTADLVDQVFGPASDRGSLVISGANGIVGAGKTMQFGSRLNPFNIEVVALDFPGVPDGIGKQFSGLARSFGPKKANQIMENVIRLHYDGTTLPSSLKGFKPRFLLEAIPEILEIKQNHYKIFRDTFPQIEIRSVTSGFPRSQLGVGIAHPAFPHEINKIFEVVEPETSSITQLLWSLGLIPMPVSDNWSFVLDVLFCGLMLAALRFAQASNMPYWKIDKYVRKFYGPNPFRAHDAIGAKGSNFLTWSCLHHLSQQYGELFKPTTSLDDGKESGQNWYPPDHFRPLVDWQMDESTGKSFQTWVLGPLLQMTSLILHENRSHLTHINAIGELCAQFRRGILTQIRELGQDQIIDIVSSYHSVHPQAAKQCWFPETFDNLQSHDWQQLYVNAEHDDQIGIITISRESYNRDVDAELNRAIDWLKNNNIDNVILSGDFHLSTQLVGADTSDFFPALENEEAGFSLSNTWSRSARRLTDEFSISVGFINGKRCLGGFLELFMHCHFLVAQDTAVLGMPEVTLPVVPGMEGCHWPFRKTNSDNYPELLALLLEGKSLPASQTVGWLIDYAGPLEKALEMAWKIVTNGNHGLTKRSFQNEAIKDIPDGDYFFDKAENDSIRQARQAIYRTITESLKVPSTEALAIQSKHSAQFMVNDTCKKGKIGMEYKKTMIP